MSEIEPRPDTDKEPDQAAIAKRAHERFVERASAGSPADHDWEEAKQDLRTGAGAGGHQPKAPDVSPPIDSRSQPQVPGKAGTPSIVTGKVVGMGVVILVLAITVSLGSGWWWWGRPAPLAPPVVLHGNVDLRQVELALNNSERITEVLVQEGDAVKRGQVMARSDTSRLKPQEAQAEAAVDAERAVVDKVHHGSRPQEIAQAQATVAADQADHLNADQQWKRLIALSTLSIGRAISQQDLDSAKAAADASQGRLTAAQQGLELVTIGPRAEDIAHEEADLRVKEAQLLLMHQLVADSELIAPCEAVVRSRLLEPGEMASPQRPIVTLAILNPKWIRAYIAESDLGIVHAGTAASILIDGFPGKPLSGWVGFISSVAEFTPKTVQTEELRSSLVYEIRVFVNDPQDDLRLGMPATVQMDVHPAAQGRR